MAKLDIAIPHNLPQQEALTRIQGLLKKLQQEQKETIRDVSEKWNDNEGEFSFSAKGFQVSGKIYAGVDTVRISSHLPFVLSFYKNTITKTIWAKGTELLHDTVRP